MSISIELFGKKLNTPLIPASGVWGYGDEYDFVNNKSIGAFCTKGLSVKAKEGNPVPRITETECGVLNSVGLQNIGIKKFIDEKIPKIKDLGPKIIVNFFGNTEQEYIEAAQMLDGVDAVFALEMNVSCPNIKLGGIGFGQDAKMLEKLTSEVKKHTKKPLIVKLTPNVTDITVIAKATEAGGADAVSLINTVRGLAIDVKTKKPVLATPIGGYSGKGIKPIALRAVYETAKVVKIPVIGIGGIYSAEDVLEFIMAGAVAVQIGSAVFLDPNVCELMSKDLLDHCQKHGIKDISSLRGAAL